MAGVYERQREQFDRFGEPICPPASGAVECSLLVDGELRRVRLVDGGVEVL